MRLTSFDMRIVRYEEIHAIEQRHFDALAEAAAIKDGDRILDCGCGYGAVARELLGFTKERRRSEKWHNVIDLVDESPIQLARAKEELGTWLADSTVSLNFILGTFPQDFNWRDKYDVVGVKMALHEMPIDPPNSSGTTNELTQKQFMKALVRCLKPGGVLVLWDLSLSPATRDFFCRVIRQKDIIAGFQTCAERRNFLNREAVSVLLASSGLVGVHQVESIDYNFSTRRRLVSELNGNEAALSDWHERIRQEMRRLSEDVLHELAYEDRGNDIAFRVKLGIFRANKPSDIRFVLDPFRGQDSGCVNVQNPAESYLDLTRQTLHDGELIHRLDGYYGLMRASILTSAYSGRKELCREGLDFLYNYTDEEKRFQQAGAYLAYLVAIYCGGKDKARASELRSMSDALTTVFRTTSSAGWLIASLRDEHTLRIDVGSCESVTGQALLNFPSSIDRFFAKMLSDLANNREWFGFQPIDPLPLVRLVSTREGGGTESVDLAAKALAENYFNSWNDSVGVVRNQDIAVDVILPCDHLTEFLKFRVVLANLCGYLRFSDTPYCYYLLPPSLRTLDRRLEAGTFVLSSPTRLLYDRFEAALKYVAGFWSGIGSLESLGYGQILRKKEDMLERNRAIAGFSHQVGHVFGAKSNFPLNRLDLREVEIGDLSEEALRARQAQILYSCLVPQALKDGLLGAGELLRDWSNKATSNFEKSKSVHEYVANDVWKKLIEPVLTVIKERTTNHQAKGRKLKLEGLDQLSLDERIPVLTVVEAALFEMIWNAFEWGDFSRDPTNQAIVNIVDNVTAGGRVVEIRVRNRKRPDDDKIHEVASTEERGKGLGHVKGMIGALQAVGRESSGILSMFSVADFDSRPKNGDVFESILTLPNVAGV